MTLLESLKKLIDDFFSRRWLPVVAIALISVLAVLTFRQLIPAEAQANEASDYIYFYEPVALNLAAGKGLVTNSGSAAIHYPPGYSLLLAAVFKLAAWFSLSIVAANLLLTLVSHSLAAMFVFLLAEKLGRPRAAFFAALVWISYPPILWLTKQPNSEIPFMAVFYGGIYLLWSAGWPRASKWLCLLAGIFGGAAALIRPIGLGAMAMLGVGLVLAGRDKSLRLRATLFGCLMLGNLLAIFPWQVWVYAQTGRVVLLSGNLVPSIRDGLRFAVSDKKYRQTISIPDDVRAMTTRIDRRFGELDSVSSIAKVVREEASPQPLALVKLLFIKAARSWYATDSGRREGLILLFQIAYLSLIAFGGWRVWKSNRQSRALLIGLALMLMYFWGMTVLTLSILRYLTPVVGLAFVLLGTHAPSRAGMHARARAFPIGVMHLTDTLDGGGAERMAVNLVNHLPRERYRVFLCTTRCDGLLDSAVAADVERLRLRRTGRFDVAAILRLRKFIAEHDIRLLHAHNTSLFVALAAAALPPFPAVIWHHHTGRFALENRAARIYQLAVRWVSGIIVVNQALAEWTERRLRFPANRIGYIPNFVSEAATQSPAPAAELPGKSGKRIVCVANIHPDKDHSTLLQAMKQVTAKIPDAHLLLVGEARNADFLETTTAELVRLGLIRNVSLMGQQNNVAQLLSACDVGVLSSVSEGLPMALLEYGLAGLPVVATEVGQCPDVLAEGKVGIIVPSRQPERLAEGLIALLESPELRRQFGDRFQQRVNEVYSPQAAIAQVESFYQEVYQRPDHQVHS